MKEWMNNLILMVYQIILIVLKKMKTAETTNTSEPLLHVTALDVKGIEEVFHVLQPFSSSYWPFLRSLRASVLLAIAWDTGCSPTLTPEFTFPLYL